MVLAVTERAQVTLSCLERSVRDLMSCPEADDLTTMLLSLSARFLRFLQADNRRR